MNNGAFGENFPYSNFHDLNMDWIIKIAKDFLDQYTNIQQTITDGLEDLDTKAQELETLLQQWYDTHSEDIANQLVTAVASATTAFNQAAEQKAAQTIASIPSDYSTLSGNVNDLIRAVTQTGITFDTTDFTIKVSDNTWSKLPSGGYSYIFNVVPGDIINIVAGAATCYYAILNSANVSEGVVADYATGSTITGINTGLSSTITVPNNGHYLFVFGSDGSISHIPNTLTVNGYNMLLSVRDNITDIQHYFTDNSIINCYDPKNLTDGYVINFEDGTPLSNRYTANYSITDYIPINYGDMVHLAFVRGLNLCGGAFYDSDKNFLYPIWGTSDYQMPDSDSMTDYEFIIQDKRIAYFRYNVVENPLFPRSGQYIWVRPNTTFSTLYNPVLTVGAGQLFTTLKGVFEYIINNNVMNATVHVTPGTYDLVQEYTQEYLDSYTASSNVYFGLLVGNNTHVIFDEGAYVTFAYTGSNTAVAEHFSAFNIVGSCIIENANIYVSNARYCVHEDLPAGSITPKPYTVKYIDCTMQHGGNSIGDYTGTVCIGAGTMPNSLSIIEGGKYICGTQFPWAISYHNFNKTTFGNKPSKVILKNVWMNNGFRMGAHSDSIVRVVVTNCKMPSGWYPYDSQFFNLTEWNNTLS